MLKSPQDSIGCKPHSSLPERGKGYKTALLGLAVLALSGCAMINTSVKEKKIMTGIFDDDLKVIRQKLAELRVGMSKEEVRKVGFSFENKNVQCLQGSQAMPYVIGDGFPVSRYQNAKGALVPFGRRWNDRGFRTLVRCGFQRRPSF
ncbi:MAG: hypothetical protein HYV04_12450 [Deltaproteobacteria bacterium]|nr:hypothetical protein [Deltaproteobacteria bacterium]